MLDASASCSAGWRGPSYRIPGPPLILNAAFAVIVGVLSAAIRSRRPTWQWVATIILLATAALIATHAFAPNLNAKNLEATDWDVDQVDTPSVTFPGGETMGHDPA